MNSHDLAHPKMEFKKPFFVPTGEELKPGRAIEKITKPYPQFYKLVLRSYAVDNDNTGSKLDVHFKIEMPDRLHGAGILMVDSVAIEKHLDTASLEDEVIEVLINGLPQPRSYDSLTKTSTNSLVTFKGYYYQCQSPNYGGSGIPITDLNMLQNQILNIKFQRIGAQAFKAGQFTGEWIMTLLVIPTDESMSVYH